MIVNPLKILLTGVLIIPFMTSLDKASAQSFNCLYARKPAEVAVCKSPILSEMDERMAHLYFKVRNALRESGRQDLLRKFQRSHKEWLRQRNTCGYDESCLTAIYAEWLAIMSKY